MTDLIRVNDTIYGFNSCTFKLEGVPYIGIQSFDYEQKRERKIVYGAKRDGTPLGRTSGKYSVPSMSLKVLKDTWDSMSTQLTAMGLGSYGDAEFVFIAQMVELGSLPITVVCSGCTIDGVKASHEEGVDELVVELEIGCLAIAENGKLLFSLARGLPL